MHIKSVHSSICVLAGNCPISYRKESPVMPRLIWIVKAADIVGKEVLILLIVTNMIFGVRKEANMTIGKMGGADYQPPERKKVNQGTTDWDKWKNSITATADKADGTDEKAKTQNSVLDIYKASAAKGANQIKPGYTEYESENYRIVPDNEFGVFTIYDKQGERYGAFQYSDIKIKQDAESGKQFLISEHGTMSYDAMIFDDELKESLQNIMGKEQFETEPLKGFQLKQHSGTGIQYLLRDGEEGRGGRVLLQTAEDQRKYDELAEAYMNKYPNLIKDQNAAYIYADLEIRGLAERTNQGILSIGFDGISYSDNSGDTNGWYISFKADSYQRLYEWLTENRDFNEEMEKISTWLDILKEKNAQLLGPNGKQTVPTDRRTVNNESTYNSHTVYFKDKDTLYSGGNGTGLSYTLKYAEDSTAENPVITARGVDENGKEFEQRIYVKDINPANATIVEMRALQAYSGEDTSLSLTSLPPESGSMKLNDKADFFSMFEKAISDMKKLGRNDLSSLFQKNLNLYRQLY